MYDALLAALRATGIPFAETAWDQRPSGAYGVVAIDSALHFYADDHVDHQSPPGHGGSVHPVRGPGRPWPPSRQR